MRLNLNEEVNKLKKEIKIKKDFGEIETINVKAESSKEIFSEYNYETNEILNEELEGFIVKKAETIPLKSKLRIKMFVEEKEKIDEKEVEDAIKLRFKRDFEDYERKLKRNAQISFILLLIGILFLGFLVLETLFLDNFILSIILEITSWVFIWEAVDKFFFERTEIRERRHQFARLYYAEVEIVPLEFKS